MEFINQQVAEKDLPKIASLVLTPLEPVYLRSLRIQSLIFFGMVLLGLAIAIYLLPVMRLPVNLASAVIGWLLVFVSSWWLNGKSFHSKGFAIREKDIIYKSGWLFQHTSACPFKRIQHCSVSSGPIDRKFGLATLRVFTAGAEGDLAIPGLPDEQAFSIKEFITQKIVINEEPGN